MRTALKLVTVIVVGLLGPAPSAHAQTGVYEEVDPGLTDPAIVDTPTPPGTRGNHLRVGPLEDAPGQPAAGVPADRRREQHPQEFTKLGTEIQTPRVSRGLPRLPQRGADRVQPPRRVREQRGPEGRAGRSARSAFAGRSSPAYSSSDLVTINEPNGIYNRLSKLLTHLATTDDEEWSQFLDASGKLDWSLDRAHRLVARGRAGRDHRGGAQGAPGGAAARLDRRRPRLGHARGDAGEDRYFTLIHARDNFFVRTCQAYKTLGLTVDCPLAGFPGPVVPDDPNPALLDRRKPPYDGDQIHVFNQPPGSTIGDG